jgi:hypothetical protein
VSKDTDWFTRYGNDPGDDFDDRSRPPIWVVIVIVVAVVAGGWMLVTQGSPDGDPVASPTTTVEASVVETTTTSAVTTRAATPGPSQQLRGYVAVASPDASSSQDTVWVYRPGGGVVSRGDAVIRGDNAEYPMLITAGHLIVGDQIFDLDLAEPPISLWTDASVYPGSGPGVVWLAGRQSSSGRSASDWVAQVDVESLTVGERVDLTDIGIVPLFGVADGLIVSNGNNESYDFWSPTDGLADVDLPNRLGGVLAASGNLVVVDTSRGVNVIDIRRRGSVVSFEFPDIPGAPTSACLSPDGQHVIIVGVNGEAFVGNITSGEVISLNEATMGDYSMDIARKHGIGWTADDQLVFIGEPEGDAQHIFGFDIATGESFVFAQLDRAEEWWLTASGTMC